ncbi:uncharacterized protein DUF3182 [Luteimonas cucumeris]|uniref:Uncharacterized protein DUF3182 n=2 Tax=Luteimonas cucumeris TaxID=985012 RepID=A0A562L2L6_9GAMM|nr:uncharacterized protein DUF3182 [Luteimonas cucumeris]
MMTTSVSSSRPVLLFNKNRDVDPAGHDHLTRVAMAQRIATLINGHYAGVHDSSAIAGHPYFIPDNTLLREDCTVLGIQGEDDLYGGVVPHAFLTNKTISHPLPDMQAVAPDSWSPRLAQRIGNTVLPGYSAFSRNDAQLAGERLLEGGRVRVKRAAGVGGEGQAVVDSIEELMSVLDGIDRNELCQEGVVIERDLDDALTYSVGVLRVAGRQFAYCGTQFMVEDRNGIEVYGGSELHVVRGGFAQLQRLLADDERVEATGKAIQYDAAVSAEFPDFFASRRNYDVAAGRDSRGLRHCGVLEQSWRIGGATPAEIAAVEALLAEPSLDSIVASTHELHRAGPVPAEARVHFDDPYSRSGPILKYSRVHRHGNPT